MATNTPRPRPRRRNKPWLRSCSPRGTIERRSSQPIRLAKARQDIATQATDGQTAFQAVDAMAEAFQVDPTEMKASVLNKFAAVAQMPIQHKAIAEKP